MPNSLNSMYSLPAGPSMQSCIRSIPASMALSGCMCAGQALHGVSEAWSGLSNRALAAPAGVLGTLGVTVSTLPRILLGDAVAAYQAASHALANVETAGARGAFFLVFMGSTNCRAFKRPCQRAI